MQKEDLAAQVEAVTEEVRMLLCAEVIVQMTQQHEQEIRVLQIPAVVAAEVVMRLVLLLRVTVVQGFS